MPFSVCLRLRCTCCAWRNIFECQINTDNPSRDLLGRNAWFFATQSQAARMSVISMRSTQQIENNRKLKAVESVGAKMTGSFTRE